MKKIMQIRSEFRDNGPGTQSFEIAREMKKRGYETIFVSSGGVLAKEISKEFKHITMPTLEIHKRDPISVYNTIKELSKVIMNENIDIVHGHNAAATYCAYLASKKARKEIRITHSVRGMEIRKGYKWRNWIYKMYPATFFAVSDFTKKMLIDVGVKEKNIIVTYNGVDIDRFNPEVVSGAKIREELNVSPNTVLVGQIGAFGQIGRHGKGQNRLIEATAYLKQYYSNFHVVLVGDGENRPMCEELARKLHVDKIVHFMGYRRDIPEIQAALDIAVLASENGEMFPNALLEAMAMKNPWVASRLSGIPEMSENEKNGLLATPKDARDLADKIELLLCNKERRESMGKHGYMSVREKYTIGAICDKIEKAYQNE